jgi:hypothetical protein
MPVNTCFQVAIQKIQKQTDCQRHTKKGAKKEKEKGAKKLSG